MAVAARLRPDLAVHVAVGIVGHTLCSDTFVAGLDPDRSFDETFRSMPGIRRLAPLIRYRVDRTRREVTASLAGGFPRRAVYRDGVGCALVYAEAGATAPSAPTPAAAVEAPTVAPASEALRAAVDGAFAEPEGEPRRNTKAVVILHRGRIVAERYAPGYGVDTPLLGWSLTKSVTNALVGILVRDGRLSLAGPAPIAAWREPSDPRHAITVEQLMRMTSGLARDPGTAMPPASSPIAGRPISRAVECRAGCRRTRSSAPAPRASAW